MEQVLPSLDEYIQLLGMAGRQRFETAAAMAVEPLRLPLKRRLAQFRQSANTTTTSTTSPAFEGGLWAIEKFRDLLPAFVVAIFSEHLVLEPGDVGPIPHDSAMARELIWCINRQWLSASLAEALRDLGVPFCEGGIVVGLVDYRRTALGLLGNTAQTKLGKQQQQLGPQIQQAHPQTVEMHKIFLKPSWDALQASAILLTRGMDQEAALELESQLILHCSPPLCLDPLPAVSRVASHLQMERWKHWAMLHDTLMQPPRKARQLPPNSLLLGGLRGASEAGNLARLEERLTGRGGCLSRPMLRLLRRSGGSTPSVTGLCNLLQETRLGKQNALPAPQFGLDVKRDPSKAGLKSVTNITDWVPTGQRLWRSIRFERTVSNPDPAMAEPTSSPMAGLFPMFAQPPVVTGLGQARSSLDHAYLHLLVHFNQLQQISGFEGILRLGGQPFTAAGGYITHFRLASRQAVDALVEQIKQTMLLEGRACVADVANPTILNPGGGGSGGPGMMAKAGSTSLAASGSSSLVSSSSQSGSQVNLLKKPAKKSK